MTEFDDAYIIERCNGVCFEAIEIIHALRQQLAELQFQPRLQRVTPEAILQLEMREAVGVVFVNGYDVQVASYNSSRGWWWSGGMGGRVDRPTRGYFIELAKLKEVQR